MRVLLEAGAVTAVRGPSGLTPLHCALMARSDAAAAALLTAPDASAAATAIDDTGMQPLHAAARFGRTAVIPALLSAGAAANATSSSHGFTPLHFACASGHAGAVRALLEGGAAASLEARDRDGDTPLLLAVRENHTECVDTLLQAKARLEADGIEVVGPTDHTIFQSIYFRDPSGHRLELAADTATPKMNQMLDEVKWDMLNEWDRTKKAPTHARWMHDGSYAN